jgi:hypothetical protein
MKPNTPCWVKSELRGRLGDRFAGGELSLPPFVSPTRFACSDCVAARIENMLRKKLSQAPELDSPSLPPNRFLIADRQVVPVPKSPDASVRVQVAPIEYLDRKKCEMTHPLPVFGL